MPSNDTTDRDFPQIIPIPNKRINDLTGQTFNRLTVLGFVGVDRKSEAKWLCRCECGAFVVVLGSALPSGHTRSCGCLQREVTAKRSATHRLSNTPEYRVWSGIITRCENPNESCYVNYGGRGINMCEEWRYSFERFLADMGPRPGPKYTIERIDNDGPYSPKNCRWATKAEQVLNTRASRFLEFHGTRLTIIEWSRRLHMNSGTLYTRIRKGWSIERALTTPVKKTN